MTKDQIRKSNIIIAQFMEWKTEASGYAWYLSAGYDEDNLILKYHKDWNMLIEACQKWDVLYRGKNWDPVTYKNYEKLCDKLDHFATLYEIEPVWEQLVKCIKWFNKIKKK